MKSSRESESYSPVAVWDDLAVAGAAAAALAASMSLAVKLLLGRLRQHLLASMPLHMQQELRLRLFS